MTGQDDRIIAIALAVGYGGGVCGWWVCQAPDGEEYRQTMNVSGPEAERDTRTIQRATDSAKALGVPLLDERLP